MSCIITPTNHVHNLDVDLNDSNTTSTSSSAVVLPQPPANHAILLLTALIQHFFQKNKIHELKAFVKLPRGNVMRYDL